MSLDSYIRAMPKAELHVHLEATIKPTTLLQLAKHNGVALPAETPEELKAWFVFRDFEHFRDIYRTCVRALVATDDYELIVHELGRDMARQNIRYAEVSVGPTAHSLRGIPQQTYMDGLSRGRRRAREDFGVEINWRFELGRGPEQGPETWDYATSVAIEGKDDGVLSLGLSGPEYRLETSLFAPWFDRARAAGLHSAPHAGELAGPHSVWQALQMLGAERIGHGVRSVEDPALVDHLARKQIPLEICPWSNIRLGLYESLQHHPLPRFHAAGVPMTVNSDDPCLFDTTLTGEILSLVDSFELDGSAVDEIVLNAVRHSFLPADRKEQMEARFRREMDILKTDGEPAQVPAGSTS